MIARYWIKDKILFFIFPFRIIVSDIIVEEDILTGPEFEKFENFLRITIRGIIINKNRNNGLSKIII